MRYRTAGAGTQGLVSKYETPLPTMPKDTYRGGAQNWVSLNTAMILRNSDLTGKDEHGKLLQESKSTRIERVHKGLGFHLIQG
jgi:hypothetical protein